MTDCRHHFVPRRVPGTRDAHELTCIYCKLTEAAIRAAETPERTPMTRTSSPVVAAERTEYRKGSRHELTTAKGSHVVVDSRVDQYGRCSSHVITGYNAKGLSGYFARNVSARDVAKLVRMAEDRGWTGIAANVEAF